MQRTHIQWFKILSTNRWKSPSPQLGQPGKSEGRDEFYNASKGWVISLWQTIGFPGCFLNKWSQVRADREQGFWEILLQSHSLEQYLWDTPHAQLQPASLPEMCRALGGTFFLLSACSHCCRLYLPCIIQPERIIRLQFCDALGFTGSEFFGSKDTHRDEKKSARKAFFYTKISPSVCIK